MKIDTNNVRIWFPEIDEFDGAPFIHDGTNQNMSQLNFIKNSIDCTSLVEPNYAGFLQPESTSIALLQNQSQLKSFDPLYNGVPCDGIAVSKEFMQRNSIALLTRTSDAMAMVLICDNSITLLQITITGICNTIFKEFPTTKYHAVLGACIGKSHYCLDSLQDANTIHTCKEHGYEKHLTEIEKKVFVDIRGIVKQELDSRSIPILYEDTRDTYECPQLGSYRRDGSSRISNPCVVSLMKTDCH